MSDATRTHDPLHRPEQEPGEERLADLAPWTPPSPEEAPGDEDLSALEEELADLDAQVEPVAEGMGHDVRPVPSMTHEIPRTLSVVEAFRVSDLGLGVEPAARPAQAEDLGPDRAVAAEPVRGAGLDLGAEPVPRPAPAEAPRFDEASTVEPIRGQAPGVDAALTAEPVLAAAMGLDTAPSTEAVQAVAPETVRVASRAARVPPATEPFRAVDSELEATPVPWPQGLTDLSSWAAPAPALLGRPTPPVELPLPVLVRVEQALAAPEAERPEAASRLNWVLAQLAQGGGERQVADTLHRLLDSGRLEGLVDTRGRSCRAVAVESLLSLGFPYALEVQPEDLKHLRANTASRPKRRPGALDFGPEVPALVLGGGVFAQMVEEFLRPGVVEGTVTLQVGLSVLAMLALWLAPPRTPVYRLGLGLLALVSGYGLLLALGSAGHAGGLWAGVAGAVAVLLAALRES